MSPADVAKGQEGSSTTGAPSESNAASEPTDSSPGQPVAQSEANEGSTGFWDWLQGGLDVGGVFEPTPFCDLANGLISALRGKWTDAGLSVAGVVPYVGDAGKIAKYGNKLRKAEKVVEVAGHHPWPKYLQGPVKQALEKLPTDLHSKYHTGLDKLLPRQYGSEYYRQLSPEKQAENFELLRKVSVPRTASSFSGGDSSS